MRLDSRLLVMGLVPYLLCITAAPAHARREEAFRYPFSRVWTTAVRLLRVDLECPITEKDRDEGYFFFEYTDERNKYPGSLELITTQVDGNETVRVVVQVPAMPSYLEALILDRLGRKLQDEFGSPNEGKNKPSEPPGDRAPSGSESTKDKSKAAPKPTENPKSS